MYVPKIYKLEDEEIIFRFMKENPFAIIVSELNGKITAIHMPVEIEKDRDGNSIIRTHMAKSNPQWKGFNDQQEVLVIFNGPHAYISSSWYDHVNVPTWNYVAVHVYGKPKILDDSEAYGVLERLVNRYEKNSEHPFKIEALSDDYLKNHLKALVAFEISIDRIDAKEKLSQNRDAHNYDLIIRELDKQDDPRSKEIRNEMDRVKKKLFEK